MSRNDRGAAPEAGRARTRTRVGRSRISRPGILATGRRRRILAGLAAGTLALGGIGVALAETLEGSSGQLIEFGPVDAVTGYPTWYRDAGFTDPASGAYYDSVDLEPCLGDTDPLCLPAPAPDPSKPMDPRTGNFPDEFFYYSNTAANLASNGGNPVLFESNLEGAWSAEEVRDGDQAVFGRIRIRVEGLRSGAEYTVTHPQGIDRFTATADRRGINYTQDIAPVPKGFDAAFKSRVGPFLRWAPNPEDPNDRAPAGYIGDPATDHKVVGSPFGTNYIRITGPEVGGPAGSVGVNPNPCPTDPNVPGHWNGPEEDCIYTDVFNLMGRMSKTGGVETNRATYARAADGKTTFDIFSRSKGSQSMIVRDRDGSGSARFATTPLVGRQGKYFAHVDVTDGELPKTVTVANLSDDPDSLEETPLHDLVTVTSAVFDTNEHTLTVQARSSDELRDGDGTPAAKLTLPEYGDAELVDGTAKVDLDSVAPAMTRPVAPISVRVASTGGDIGVGQVVATGPATAAVSAAAFGPTTVEQGSRVTLSAAGSLGQITGYEWTAPAGVSLDGADTATPSFTVPTLDPTSATQDLTFTLKVTGPAGEATDTVTVKVLAVATPKAIIAPVGVAEPGTPLTIDGSRSTGATTYAWTYQPAAGDPAVDLGDTTSPTLQFTYPTGTPLDPATGDPRRLTFRLTVTNVVGQTSAATVAVTSATTDALTATTVRYVDDKRRWVVNGTAKLWTNNQVTVHAGPTLDGPVLGKATVASVGGAGTVGTWNIDQLDSPVTLGDATCGDPLKVYCVSLESSRGGSTLAVAVDRANRLPQPDQLPADQQPTTPPTTTGTVAAAAVPLAGAALRAARVAAPAAVAVAALATTGMPVTVNVPTGATVVRLRVLTTAGTPLFSTFKQVKGGTQVKVRIRSAKLRRAVRAGKRYVLEVRAGTARNRLGKATRKVIRVRR